MTTFKPQVTHMRVTVDVTDAPEIKTRDHVTWIPITLRVYYIRGAFGWMIELWSLDAKHQIPGARQYRTLGVKDLLPDIPRWIANVADAYRPVSDDPEVTV